MRWAQVYAKGTAIALAYLSRLQESERTRTLSIAKWGLDWLPVEVTDIARLTDLSVASNNITVLPPEIRKLVSLVRLNVTDNSIAALPPELGALTALTDLLLEGNPMDAGFPSVDVWERGLPFALDFLREVLAAKDQRGDLDIGRLAVNALHLDASTLPSLHRLALTRAPAYALDGFTLSGTPDQLAALTTLSLHDCALEFAPQFALALTMLKCLDLSCNRFTDVPETLSEALPLLVELNMEHNAISTIGDHVSLLCRLRILRLGSNSLTKVSEVVGEALTALTELCVESNQIELLPANFSRTANSLTSLNLEHNRFAALPDTLLSLTLLRSLRLAGNPISELPLALGSLAFLKEITVPSTDLGSVPRDVVQVGGAAVIRFLCGMAECQGSGLLDFSGMNLHVIPPSVRGLSSSLTMLNLDGNPLPRLPNWVGELQSLQRISLRGTPVQRLPATLGAIQALQEVALDGGDTDSEPGVQIKTRLVSPPPVVVAAGNAAVLAYLRRSYAAVLHRQLDLSGFALTEFPFAALSAPSMLTSLSLSNNAIGAIPADLAALTGLKHLDLAGNCIAELPAHIFARLSVLRSLSVKGNPVAVLPLTLGGLEQLEYLDFDPAPLTSPPRDVSIKSVQALLHYVRRAYAGRASGHLDLSQSELSEIPAEVCRWSPVPAEGPLAHPAVGAALAAVADAPAIEAEPGQRGGGSGEEGGGGSGEEDAEESETAILREVDDDAVLQGDAYLLGEQEAQQDREEVGRAALNSGTRCTLPRASAPLRREVPLPGRSRSSCAVRKRYLKGRLLASMTSGALAAPDAACAFVRGLCLRSRFRSLRALSHGKRGARGTGLTLGAGRYAEEDADRTFEEEADLEGDNLVEAQLPQHSSEVPEETEDGPLEVSEEEEEEEPEVEGALLEEHGVQYRSLLSLDLRNNNIAQLREEVSAMQGLRVVMMCHNEVRELPGVIAQLRSLTLLAATHNHIRTVPDDLGLLRHSLRILRLDNNALAAVPPAFAALKVCSAPLRHLPCPAPRKLRI